MKVLVSACLLGENCKYNGGNNFDPVVVDWLQDHEVVPVCPEVLAGMPVPRVPVELRGGRAVNKEGADVDVAYRAGAAQAVRRAKSEHIELAVLKSRSPTCGVRQIYDGTFSGTLIDGQGLLAQALQENGFRVIDAEDLKRKGRTV